MESKLGLYNHSLRFALPHIDSGVIRTSQGCIGEVLGMLCINCGTQTTIAVTPHSSIITGRSRNLIIFKNCIFNETLTLSLKGREFDECRCNVMNVTIK